MAERKTCMTLSLGDETIEQLKEMAQENDRSYTAEMALLIKQAYKQTIAFDRPRDPVDNEASADAPF
jgi:predicted transcriptional regulator